MTNPPADCGIVSKQFREVALVLSSHWRVETSRVTRSVSGSVVVDGGAIASTKRSRDSSQLGV